MQRYSFLFGFVKCVPGLYRLRPYVSILDYTRLIQLELSGNGYVLESSSILDTQKITPPTKQHAPAATLLMKSHHWPVIIHSQEDKGTDIHASGPVTSNGACHFDVQHRGFTLAGLDFFFDCGNSNENDQFPSGEGRIRILSDYRVRGTLSCLHCICVLSSDAMGSDALNGHLHVGPLSKLPTYNRHSNSIDSMNGKSPLDTWQKDPNMTFACTCCEGSP